MKRILHIPLLLLTTLQLVILFYFWKYDSFLATTVQSLLASTAFYSACISVYSNLFIPKRKQWLQWFISALIFLLTLLLVYAQPKWLHWIFIGILYLIQIQHLFFYITTEKKHKIKVLILGLILFIVLILNYLTIIPIPLFYVVILLLVYSVFIFISLFQKLKTNEK